MIYWYQASLYHLFVRDLVSLCSVHILVLNSKTGLNIKRNGVALVVLPLNHQILKRMLIQKTSLFNILLYFLRNKDEVHMFIFFK
jgi:hypothetical protein